MFPSRIAKARFMLATALLLTLGLSAETKHSRPAPRPHHPKHIQHKMKNGNSVERRSDGRVSDVHNERRHMDVHHGLNGDRRTTTYRSDHSRIVTERGRAGFVEHPYSYHGHDYYRRTYYYHGRVYSHYYRGFYFHGVGLHVYVPGAYYSTGFYGWAYHPWHTHVIYRWGWYGHPWYVHYGYYFAPYPYYVGPSAWLTDYVISTNLAAAYDAGVAAGSAGPDAPVPPGGPALTPDVKDQLNQEIQFDIELENGEAALEASGQETDPGSSGIARIFADTHPHVFVVGAPLDVVNEATEHDCALSEGDILQTTTAPGPDDKAATLTVLSSKGPAECAKNTAVSVSLDDLQEMQNSLRQTLHQGMDELQQNQGKDGLPQLPAAAATPPTPTSYAKLAPPPDPDAAAELQQQQTDADQSEKEVTTQEAQEPETPPAPTQPAAPIERPKN